MEKFYLDQFIKEETPLNCHKEQDFHSICRQVNQAFISAWEAGEEEMDSALRIQKNAIIGWEKEVSYFKTRIREILKGYGWDREAYPAWYETLEDAIYHENWGLAGVAEWFKEAYEDSSSAKIIGERIYFLVDGQMKLQPQTISKERREQLIRAFLLLTPEERLDKEFHEIYMLDGTRITVFGGSMTKAGQDVIIFRRYVVPVYGFEEQAARGTIPYEAIPLFKSMVDIGYNVIFCGTVRSAKTTFLSTWQRYENPALEGVMVETDPEIPLDRIMPGAPIVQLLADNEKLRTISKNLLRSDADYFILAEARDGVALDTAIRIAGKGTKRMKMTFHSREPLDLPYDVAREIVNSFGGDIHTTAKKVAGCFDYVFHFIQLSNKSEKRLKSIYEMNYDRENGNILMNEICRYENETGRWRWTYAMNPSKVTLGQEENPETFRLFTAQLDGLANPS